MKSSEISSLLEEVPQVLPFFRGICAIDELATVQLKEDDFLIVNTE